MMSRFCKWVLDVLGWEVIGISILQNIDKAVLAVAPHTSSWDFFLALFVRKAYKFDSRFLGKKSLFKPPLKFIFEWLGGYPVDRKHKTDLVKQCIDIFNQHNKFLLALAPEGTRKAGGKFKSGFYHIAQGANVDIILTTFDFEHKKVIFEPCFQLTGDSKVDIAKIEQHFSGIKGKNDL